MSTETNKDWILCRSYRFPNKFYYFNIHNGESKWAHPEKKTLLNSDKSKVNCDNPNINLNIDVEPNIKTVASLLTCRGLDNNLEMNCNKSQKQDNQQSQTFVSNEKTFLLHSQIHTPTTTKENKQKYLQQQKKKEKKTLAKNHRSFSPPLLKDSEGRYDDNTLNGIKIGQKSFRMYNKPGYNRQRKVIWDPYIKFHSSDNQSEDFTKEALSSITNKMEDINLLSCSSNILTGEKECDNFIMQHDQKWFIFRDDPQNEEMVKFQTFGQNGMGKVLKKNMATMKHETKDTCFIVIDLNVLLSDFQFINDKVLQDTRYRLVIPNAVITKLRNLAEMDHKSHQLMVTAQNLIWKIPTQSRHIILEPEQPLTQTSQQIISCCKKIKNLDYNLILLTSDADLYASAIDHKLICYMIQDVKKGLCGQLFNDSNIREEKDINNNLFLQKLEDIEPYNFSQLTSDVNENFPFFDDFACENAELKETVYEKFKKYSLRNRHMASLIILRAEDYMCTFTQIMETFMLDLLLNENVSCDFCTIPQAVDAVAQLYPDSKSIQIVAYRMSALYNLIKQKNKLETKYKADVLIKMVGCGMILVESIKPFKPNSEIMSETEYLLVKLIKSIENPNRFENDVEQSKIVRKYDSSETSYEDYDNRPAEDYYNEHLTDVNGNEDISKQTNLINNRIIRTTGRNLNSLIISNTNGILLDIDEKCDIKIDNKFKEGNNIDIKLNLNKDNDTSKTVFDSTVHENAFTSLENAPKVITNFDAIKTFEEKLLNKSIEKIDNIDVKFDLNIKESNVNKNKYTNMDLDKISETYTDIAYQTEVYNSESLNDKCVTENQTLSASNDSGLGKNCCNAHLVIEEFIYEMSSTLKIVYDFIKDTSLVLKGKDIKPENRREIFDKAYKTYHRMTLVVDNLTNILKREEEAKTTVITLLERAGIDVANNKLITKYKQIVSAYLEQIDLLQQALKIIYITTNSNLISSNLEVTSTCY